jgi:glycosyltransferase 2 family protein
MKNILKIFLTAFFMVGVFWFFDIPINALYIKVSAWGYVAVSALLILTLIPLFAVIRWSIILRGAGIKESLLTLWGINLKALFLGLFLPGTQSSDLIRIVLMERRHPEKSGVVGSTVFIERMMGLSLLAVWALVALPAFFGNPRFSLVAGMVGLMNLAVFGLILILFLSQYLSRDFRVGTGLLGRIVSYLGRFHGSILRFPYRQGLLVTLVIIGLYQLSLILIVFLLFHALGHPLPFTQHLIFYPLISVLTILPITIGGFGLREGAFVWFYSLVGVPAEVAIGVSVANYVVVILLPALLGGILLLRASLSGSAPPLSPL